MKIPYLEQSDFNDVKSLLSEIDAADDPVTKVMDVGILNQGDVCATSGLNTTTLRVIRLGKTPTKAQRAALKFAMLHRLLNL